MDSATAFEIFIASFTLPASRRQWFTRRALGPLWLLHHEYVWRGEQRVGDSIFIRDTAPAFALAILQTSKLHPPHTLIVVDDQADTLAAYTHAGYRCSVVEYVMARSLTDLPRMKEQDDVRRISEPDEAAWFSAYDPEGNPWTSPINHADPSLAHYARVRDDQSVARARAIRYDASCSYVTHVFTHPAYRRRGFGQAVMLHLLHDCAVRGETENVLVASEEGDLLYRSLGYTRLATILVFEIDDSMTKE